MELGWNLCGTAYIPRKYHIVEYMNSTLALHMLIPLYGISVEFVWNTILSNCCVEQNVES